MSPSRYRPISVIGYPGVRGLQGARLQLANRGSDVAGGFSADIKQFPEFVVGRPAQIPELLVASTDQRSQHNRPQPETMAGQDDEIVQPNIHPGRALRGTTQNQRAEVLFLACEKSHGVGILSERDKAFLQLPFRAEDLVAWGQRQIVDGTAREILGNASIELFGHGRLPPCQDTEPNKG